MTVIELQNELMKELNILLANERFNNAKDERVPIQISKQSLPTIELSFEDEGNEDDAQFPYLVVRLMDGEIKDYTDPESCKVLIVAGLYDENNDNQGYQDIAGLIEKIKQHLLKKMVINGQYTLQFPLKWVLPEEDTNPYYFGGIECNWECPRPQIEGNDC